MLLLLDLFVKDLLKHFSFQQSILLLLFNLLFVLVILKTGKFPPHVVGDFRGHVGLHVPIISVRLVSLTVWRFLRIYVMLHGLMIDR